MANQYRKIDIDMLNKLANEYLDECIDAKQEQATGSGKIVSVKSRHIPTIDYFLNHWIRRKDFYFYKKSQFYTAKKDIEHPLSETIKGIDESFKALAVDIVANEGKGIFYAKNRLGMTDRMHTDNTSSVNILNIDPLDEGGKNKK